MCDCISKLDEELKPRGVQVEVVFDFFAKPQALVLPRIALNALPGFERKRGLPKHIAGQYCPFCGNAYVREQEEKDTTDDNSV